MQQFFLLLVQNSIVLVQLLFSQCNDNSHSSLKYLQFSTFLVEFKSAIVNNIVVYWSVMYLQTSNNSQDNYTEQNVEKWLAIVSTIQRGIERNIFRCTHLKFCAVVALRGLVLGCCSDEVCHIGN